MNPDVVPHTPRDQPPGTCNPTQTHHHHQQHGLTNETWARDVSALAPKPVPCPIVPVSLPQASAAHVRVPAVPAVSAQSPASCMRSDQRFVPRGPAHSADGLCSDESHRVWSGMASLSLSLSVSWADLPACLNPGSKHSLARSRGGTLSSFPTPGHFRRCHHLGP